MSPITLPIASTGLTTGLPGQVAAVGSGVSIPPGIEAVIECNSAYLNVRSWADTYLITEIDGFGDADIRDARDVNPGAHGETPFDAYYGGRTITLTGLVRAQSLKKLRDMQQGLRQMFSDLSAEFPLIFHAADPANDCMVYVRKSAPLAMKEAQTNFSHTRDFLVTLRASNPRILSRYTSFGQWQGGTIEGFPANATVTATNLVANPSAETNLTGYTGDNAVLTRSTAQKYVGSNAILATLTSTAVGYFGATYTLPVTGGLPYSGGVRIRTGVARTLNIYFQWLDSGGTPIGTPMSANVAATGGFDLVSMVNQIAPANAVNCTIYIRIWSNTAADTAYIDALQFHQATVLPAYFDGDTNGGTGYRWTGVPHASTSEQFDTVDSGLGANWSVETGLGSASVRNNALMQSNPSEFRAVRQGVGYKLVDGRITVKFTTGASIPAAAAIGVTFRKQSATNELMAQYYMNDPVSGQFYAYTRRLGGSFNNLATATFNPAVYTLAANTSYWARFTFQGNLITGELFTSDPAGASQVPVQTYTFTLAGADAAEFGAGISGDVGIRLTSLTDDYRIDDYRTEVIGASGFQVFSGVNNGNFPAQPQFQITGPVTGPKLTLINGQTNAVIGAVMFRSTVTIPAGTTYFIDIAKRTIVDQNGVNKFTDLDVNSDWPEMVSGLTQIQLSGSAMDYRTSATAMWRHTWL